MLSTRNGALPVQKVTVLRNIPSFAEAFGRALRQAAESSILRPPPNPLPRAFPRRMAV
jgi:hypothetical protein